ASRWARAAKLLDGLAAHEPRPADRRGGAEHADSASPGAESSGESSLDFVVLGSAGPFRMRWYRANASCEKSLVLGHGVHWKSIHEPRLVAFAQQLARAGVCVATPELRDLADYRITRSGLTTLIDAVRHIQTHANLAGDRPVGLMGLSFAGGLSL